MIAREDFLVFHNGFLSLLSSVLGTIVAGDYSSACLSFSAFSATMR